MTEVGVVKSFIMKSYSSFIFALTIFVISKLVDSAQPLPSKLSGVGIQDNVGSTIVMTAPFVDEKGSPVSLSNYFNRKIPVIFTVAYFNCPLLCSLVHKGLVEAINGSGMTVGKDFNLLTISMDPRDKPKAATAYQNKFESLLFKKTGDQTWPFLTGLDENIRVVTDSIGFNYRYDKQTDQYLHQAGIFVIEPEGRITRILTGIAWKPFDLKVAVIEAKNATKNQKFTSIGEQIILFCYSYNHDLEGYALKAMNLMRLAGAATLFSLLVLVFFLMRKKPSHLKKFGERDF